MKLVVFGLTMSSSWGNGHATLWRALASALARDGHRLVFFEHDVPYYAQHRDLVRMDGVELVLYRSFDDVRGQAAAHLDGADAAIVTSYCPDAQAATELSLASNAAVKAFYDMDTGVTIERLEAGERVEYVPSGGLGGFDVVLSFVGGGALEALVRQLGARWAVPLYGSVDADLYRPLQVPRTAHLSYLGTWAANRQKALDQLFLEPARRMPEHWFCIGGSQYPPDFPWEKNVRYVFHVPPPEHPAFYCSAHATLNVTRAPMARFGYCPSGRIFEAAACGIPVVTDAWEGIDTFFTPGSEILVATSAEDVVDALCVGEGFLRRIGERARERALDEHSGTARARELVHILDLARARGTAPGVTALGGGRP
ncbi:MAG: glycosyltransferase [Myxococcaceae bacterium]|nr:glycosyltransferase [Myxococcaceae bacterium]